MTTATLSRETQDSQENSLARQYFLEEFGVDIRNQHERVLAAKHSFRFFCLYYLVHYFNLHPADFHYDLWEILEDPDEEATGIIGFRGSGKSAFCSMAYPLWCAIFCKYHFIILINDTTAQMRINILNIKTELEENEYLARDFPNIRSTNKWTEEQLQLTSGVYIMGRSRGQKVRGLRFKQYRPDLIICDDLEDIEWVRTKENRDKTERWFKSEVVPAQEELKAKMIVIGNLLHRDAFMSRLDKWGRYRVLKYPLVDADGFINWTSKYPSKEAVLKQKDKVNSPSIWSREYMLKVISEEEQVIHENDIVYYSNERLTTNVTHLRIIPRKAGTGVDLAISEKQTADYTAMVSGVSTKEDGIECIYVKPNPVNKRMDLHKTVQTADTLNRTMPAGHKLYVEGVAYQQAATKEMKRKGLPAIDVRPIGDKRARLETVAIYVKQGMIRFPKTGCEDLITQLIGFGVEEHDDLVDAFVYMVLGILNRKGGSAGMGRGDTI